MISLKSTRSGNSTEEYIKRLSKQDIRSVLNKYGQLGVIRLSKATPVRTGLTAASWNYRIVREHRGWRVEWYNSNINKGTQVAVILQYGHSTGTGGWVPGIDYVNPAIAPVFENAIAEIWKEVQK